MAFSECRGATSYLEHVAIHPDTELPDPSKVTTKMGTVVACEQLRDGMCRAFPHIKDGSSLIAAPLVTLTVCNGPNP